VAGINLRQAQQLCEFFLNSGPNLVSFNSNRLNSLCAHARSTGMAF
jgi:hypothetical protein